jgi:hypothetical protein
MNYQLYTLPGQTVPSAAMTIGLPHQVSFIFAPGNTDYQQFKKDLANGVQLEDATGTVMTADQITTFMETLP